MRDLCDQEDTDVTAIPANEEDYICFRKTRYSKVPKRNGETFVRMVNLQFIHSFRHLQCSLARLVSYLPKEEFHTMRKKFNDEQLALFTRKGVYPYEYMDSFEKLEESASIDKFGSKLGCRVVYAQDDPVGEVEPRHISQEEYDYKVWFLTSSGAGAWEDTPNFTVLLT